MKKEKVAVVRVSEEDYSRWTEVAKSKGVKLSEFIRQCVTAGLQAQANAKLSKDQIKDFTEHVKKLQIVGPAGDITSVEAYDPDPNL